jgi:hypothetical protein
MTEEKVFKSGLWSLSQSHGIRRKFGGVRVSKNVTTPESELELVKIY